jgi:DNA-binding response OmpR family regulator
VAGRPVELTPTEFYLLAVRARHPGRVFSRMDLPHSPIPGVWDWGRWDLLERVQGYAYEGYERTTVRPLVTCGGKETRKRASAE